MITSEVQYTGQLGTEAQHLKSGAVILTDAPVDNNGKGANFSPTDLVATALASCAITIMGIAAEKHQIPFENVKATVEKIMGTEPRRITGINVVFTLGDELTDKQRSMLEHAARTCPVAQSLAAGLEQNLTFNYANASASVG